MVRIQLHLTEEQDRRLRGLARKRGVARAELIRRGIDLVLSEGSAGHDSVLELLGAAGPSPRQDISERHDDLLYEVLNEQPLPRAAEPPPKVRGEDEGSRG